MLKNNVNRLFAEESVFIIANDFHRFLVDVDEGFEIFDIRFFSRVNFIQNEQWPSSHCFWSDAKLFSANPEFLMLKSNFFVL